MKKRIVSAIFVLLLLVIGMTGCSKKEYTVNFNTDGGSFIEAVVVEGDGQKISKPEDPVKEGYVFKEWQVDDKKISSLRELEFVMPENAVGVLRLKKKHKRKKTSTAIMPMLSM